MDPISLLKKYYPEGDPARDLLLRHALQVADLAEHVARANGLPPASIRFVREAALLHDIGIRHTDCPDLGCFGDLPYIRHGVKGREMLEAEGFFHHALVAERHVGTGITRKEVVAHGLPLPERDMVPLTPEQEVVGFADKFFSKAGEGAFSMKSPETIARGLAVYAQSQADNFLAWLERYGPAAGLPAGLSRQAS